MPLQHQLPPLQLLEKLLLAFSTEEAQRDAHVLSDSDAVQLLGLLLLATGSSKA